MLLLVAVGVIVYDRISRDQYETDIYCALIDMKEEIEQSKSSLKEE